MSRRRALAESIRALDLDTVPDYSQNGEQAIVIRYFGTTEADHAPFFVDVGAFDGRTGSNTHLLAELGWGGLAIEPTPEAFARLQALYAENPRISCVRCAISDHDAEAAEMFLALGPEGVPASERWHYSQVSTLNEWFSREIVEQHGYRYERVQVEVQRLDSLLRRLAAPPDLGLLCIDCEGEDHKILRAFDIERFRPSLICVEADRRNRTVFAEQLAPKGYREYDHTPTNAFFSRVSP